MIRLYRIPTKRSIIRQSAIRHSTIRKSLIMTNRKTITMDKIKNSINFMDDLRIPDAKIFEELKKKSDDVVQLTTEHALDKIVHTMQTMEDRLKHHGMKGVEIEVGLTLGVINVKMNKKIGNGEDL